MTFPIPYIGYNSLESLWSPELEETHGRTKKIISEYI